MKHVVQFSGGVASWAAAKRVVAKYGTADTVLLFADTLIEDCDLYRFLDDASANLGMKVTRLCEGRTPWDVFRDNRYIANSRVDICSRVLKRETLDKWRDENCTVDDAVFYIGFDWSEKDRATKLLGYIAPWKYEFPLMDRPCLTKEGIKQWAKREGLKLPRLYKMGFDHNNCGGFCVKAGKAHFKNLLRVMPERYKFHEEKEEELRKLVGDYAILRKTDGSPWPLKEFREFVQKAAKGFDIKFDDWGGCGCATDYGDGEKQE